MCKREPCGGSSICENSRRCSKCKPSATGAWRNARKTLIWIDGRIRTKRFEACEAREGKTRLGIIPSVAQEKEAGCGGKLCGAQYKHQSGSHTQYKYTKREKHFVMHFRATTACVAPGFREGKRYHCNCFLNYRGYC